MREGDTKGKYIHGTTIHVSASNACGDRGSHLPVVKPTSPWSIRPNLQKIRAIPNPLPRAKPTMYALLLPSKGLSQSCASTSRTIVGKCGCRRRRRRFPLVITLSGARQNQDALRGRCKQQAPEQTATVAVRSDPC